MARDDNARSVRRQGPRTLAAMVKYEIVDASDLPSRISIDPNVCFGKPCVRGTGFGCLSFSTFSRAALP